MGLDIRTEGRVSLPVYASADGYVARIKVEPFGFGQAIYISHPNGFTTVYAHLNEFFPALAKYVKQQQYKQESWKIMLELPPNLFPVKKGDLIAYSGNTGGSQGPHLHFEIRRTADDLNINPMLFGLPIADGTEPVIQRLALYDGRVSVYDQVPKIYPVVKRNGTFTTGKDTILVSIPNLALSIGAFDTQSNSQNPNGIFRATLTDNAVLKISFEMDAISYLYTRNVNGHVDYKTRILGGPWLQQLFVLPGLSHSIYRTLNGNGIIDLSDGRVHAVLIEVMDAYGNRSLLRQNFLFSNQRPQSENSSSGIFHPGMPGSMESGHCAFYLSENCLYDSAHIDFSESDSHFPGSVSGLYSIGSNFIPLQDFLTVRIKPTRNLSDQQKKKVVIMRISGGEREVQKADWQNDWASGKFRDFGQFQLVIDSLPPIILLGRQRSMTKKAPSSVPPLASPGNQKKLNKNIPTSVPPLAGRPNRRGMNIPSSQIIFKVADNLKTIRNVRATLDGKWLRFSNDKEKAFIYKMDEHWTPGKHELKIMAEDEAGNVASVVFEVE